MGRRRLGRGRLAPSSTAATRSLTGRRVGGLRGVCFRLRVEVVLLVREEGEAWVILGRRVAA